MKIYLLIINLLLVFHTSNAQKVKWVFGNSQYNKDNSEKSLQGKNLKFIEMEFGSNLNFKERKIGKSIEKIACTGTQDVMNSGYDSEGNIEIYCFTAAKNNPFLPPNDADTFYVVSPDKNSGLDEVIGKFPANNWSSTVIESELIPASLKENTYYFIVKTNATSSSFDEIKIAVINLKSRNITDVKTVLSNIRTSEGSAISNYNCQNFRWYINVSPKEDGSTDVIGIPLFADSIGTPQILKNIQNSSNSIIAGIDFSVESNKLAIATFLPDGKNKVLVFDFNNETGELSNQVRYYSNNSFRFPIIEFSHDNNYLFILSGGATGVPINLYRCPINSVDTDILTCKEIDINFKTCLDIEEGPNGKLYFFSENNSSFINELDYKNNNNIKKINSNINDFRFSYAIPEYYPYANEATMNFEGLEINDSILCNKVYASVSKNTSTSIINYQWTYMNKVVGTEKILNFYPFESDTLFLKIINQEGCEKVLKKYINISPQDADFDFYLDSCTNTLVTLPLSMNGNFYLLDSNGKIITNFKNSIVISQKGNYTIKHVLNEQLSCQIELLKNIIILNNPDIPPFKIDYFPKNICSGELVTFSASPASNLPMQWSVNGSTFKNDPLFQVDALENMTIKCNVFKTQNCSKTDSIRLNFPKPVNPEFTFDYNVCTGILTLEPNSPESSYIIKDSLGLPLEKDFFKTKKAGTYTLTNITNKDKTCELTLVKQLTIKQINPINFQLLANSIKYNSITNGQFCFIQKDKIHKENYKMQIFDRWGNLIFKSNNPDDCWDGSFNGRSLESDVYTYIMYFKPISCDSSIIKISGDITLFK